MLIVTHSRTLIYFLQLNSLRDLRIALILDWTYDPGRRPGCFDARPGGVYVTYLERSFDEIKAEFDQYRQEWDSSQAKVELQEHMTHIIRYNNNLTDVVSFGTGSFQNVHIGERRRSCLQIAALLTKTGCISKLAVPYYHKAC